MTKLDNEKLEEISGGSVTLGAIGLIFLGFTAVAALVSGIISGYTHPKGCNE